MPISFACPVSFEKRDNNTVRVVAGETLLVALVTIALAVIFESRWVAAVSGALALDFVIRAFIKPRYSPLATLARGISSGLNLPKVMVDSAPKVFAARIGVIFSVTTTVLFALGLILPGTIVLAVLAVFAFLESVFSFCAGCWMYALLPSALSRQLARDFWRESTTASAA
ncbi:MAG: DUF4395 domain-containing protein [Propionibacteriaceae bacterium]|jgi:hypothetical protein|nr:DUF4395 domain-containing protein [Propionibacteriaceae bacterium]